MAGAPFNLTSGPGTEIEDDGVQVVEAAETINFGSGLSVTDNGNNKVTVDSAAADPPLNNSKTLQFYVDNSDEYLALAGNGEGMNEVPYIWAWDVVLEEIQFCNKENNADGTLDIRKNGNGSGSNIFSWTFTNVQCGYKTNGLSGVTFNAGDRMILFLAESGSNEPDEASFSLMFTITDATRGEVS